MIRLEAGLEELVTRSYCLDGRAPHGAALRLLDIAVEIIASLSAVYFYYNCSLSCVILRYSFYHLSSRITMSSMEEPKLKKAKTEVKEEHDEEDGDSEAEQGDEEAVQMQQNENGESFCELSRTRRLTVRKFKSAVLVDIREVRQVFLA